MKKLIILILLVGFPVLFFPSIASSFSFEEFLAGLAGLRGEAVNVMPLEAVTDPCPAFNWSPSSEITGYLIKVFQETEEGSSELFRVTIKEPPAPYPDNVPPLQPEALYYWKLYDAKTLNTLHKGRFYFYLLSDEQQKKIITTKENFQNLFRKYTGEPYFHVLLASYYSKRGLRKEAGNELALALGMDPKTTSYASLTEIVKNMYLENEKKLALVTHELKKAIEKGNIQGQARMNEEKADLLADQYDFSAAVDSYSIALYLYQQRGDSPGVERTKKKSNHLRELMKIVQDAKLRKILDVVD